MNNFSYFNPVKIIFGKGMIADISKEIPAGANVLMIYGGGSIKKNGVYEQVSRALEGISWQEFAGIEPNPHYETCMKAVELIKREKITFLLAVGGGSVVDATKFIAAASCFEGEPWDILVKGAKVEKALPLACVLTLPATGSEMNSGAVITRAETCEKFAFNSPRVYPLFSILDPETTYSLPNNQTANGVIDAFVHVCEQYMTYPSDAPLQDRFAESILATLVESGTVVLNNPQNYTARANIMWAATMALNGLIGCGVPQDWATHMIGHELTALHGLAHGETLAIVMPALWRVMKEDKKEKLVRLGEKVFGIEGGTDDERADLTITIVENFFRMMGVRTKLSEYGLWMDVIEPIVARFEQRGWKLGEKQNITPDVVRAILQEAR